MGTAGKSPSFGGMRGSAHIMQTRGRLPFSGWPRGRSLPSQPAWHTSGAFSAQRRRPTLPRALATPATSTEKELWTFPPWELFLDHPTGTLELLPPANIKSWRTNSEAQHFRSPWPLRGQGVQEGDTCHHFNQVQTQAKPVRILRNQNTGASEII